jgi:imidazole glycerol phosphate synthase subunit HisF
MEDRDNVKYKVINEGGRKKIFNFDWRSRSEERGRNALFVNKNNDDGK